MPHTHITLVGGQPIPVYQGILFAEPDQVIFVCSEQSKVEAERIQREINIDSEIYIVDPVDLAVIKERSKVLKEQLTGQQLSLNITSGTKPWAYYFAQTFGNDELCEVYYVDQNTMMRSFKDFSMHEVNVDMDVRFRLHNNLLTEYTSLDEFTEEDIEAIPQIKAMRRFNFRDFNELTHSFSAYKDESEFRTNNGSRLSWSEEDSAVVLRFYNNRGEFKVERFDSPFAEMLFTNTGWFELEIADMISRWDKVREVRLNCVFPTKRDSAKNEIDVIVDTGSKLLFVECKTQIFNITDIDKFASAVKVYGGQGSKSLVVTDAVMRDDAIEKCRDNRVLTFSLATDRQNAETKLHELLDQELSSINL